MLLRLPSLTIAVVVAVIGTTSAEPDYGRDVLPILKDRCLSCHGEQKKGGFDLRSRAGMLRGGETGPAIVAGDAAKSELIKRIESGEMPPKKSERLTSEQIGALKKWIAAGAKIPTDLAGADAIADGRKHWAFQKLIAPNPPQVKNADRVRNAIDQFLLARLENAGLTFAVDADRATLIRRASLDLIGLPPSPDEVDAFVNDKSVDAYEKLIDRLLASPHFGERWGRHWLDGAGYVDVVGGDNDAATVKLGENKWLYRDYVIRALNHDKPFDRLLSEQLAGDELVDWRNARSFTPEIREALIATGFLRTAGDDTDENELNTLDIRHGVLQRTAEVLANNLLGLTLNCAKCHDHKYEPILQRDYYSFLALLQPAFNPDQWLQPKQRLLAAMPPYEKKLADEHNATIDKKIAKLNQNKSEPEMLKKQMAELNAQKRTWENWQVVYDVGSPTPTKILKRGNHETPGAEVQPGFLSVLETRARFAASGRRLALAQCLNDEKTPAGALVLRVRVNRIWRHLFGKGLVEPSDNFGVTGAKPTHPELLEWLTTEFVRNDRQLKPFLMLLLTSSAYQQSSTEYSVMGTPNSTDPDNRLLWRMPLRRLESEIIRDSILVVSGKLDRSLGGPPISVDVKLDGSLVPKDGDRPRRSVYLLGRRNYHPTFLGVFDQPTLTTNCTGRQASAVVMQPLTMLNDPFMTARANDVAHRIQSLAKPGQEIDMTFRMVLGRPPTAKESAIALELIEHQRANRPLAHLCHVLLNTSEFLYVP
jgi:mono/diheme cytochrome c family protein/cytochrome c553